MKTPSIAREQFLHRFETLVKESIDNNAHVGLLLIDLSNLGIINRRHSYEVGDALLVDTARELRNLATTDDTSFRIGNHTFALVLARLQQPPLIAMALTRVQQALTLALHSESLGTKVRLCIGFGVTDKTSPSALMTLANAEAHLTQVRRGEAPGIDEVLLNAPTAGGGDGLELAFQQALYNNEFALHYQPQIELASGRLVGAEALLRWEHAELGFISPERIVRLAEREDLEFELTRAVANIAIRQASDWLAMGLYLPLAINVSANLVSSRELPEMLDSALNIWGVSPSDIIIEITEQAVVNDIESGVNTLADIRDIGLQISIDDFGTGYSSLSYFRSIPAEELKIDRSFIARLVSDEQDQNLVRIIVEIARLFDMRVVAEGVEDEQTLRRLSDMECDMAQGYLFARPLPPELFEEWIRTWAGRIPMQNSR